MRDRDEDMSIEELCRPLSAKVLPRSMLHNVFGHPLEESVARVLEHRAIRAKVQGIGRKAQGGRG
jgi:hypothetical protein